MPHDGKPQPPTLNYAKPPARKADPVRALLGVGLGLLVAVVAAFVLFYVLIGFAFVLSRAD
jgi:high-affinity Fe2+/Pb2+ permease